MAKSTASSQSAHATDLDTGTNVPAELGEVDWSDMSYEQALKLFQDDMVSADAETMGDGFTKLRTKDQLIGQPFFIVRGTFTPGIGKKGQKVTLRVVTQDGGRFFFSDGSEGIYSQLRKLVPPPTTSFTNVNCPKGLRASRFHWDEAAQRVTKDGEPNAATYYIDVS